ncbi:MAG: right-handed parallel beta-helix repeat-containing protein [Planctomycetota bacterium]
MFHLRICHLSLILFAVGLAFAAPRGGGVLYVDDNAAPGGDGLSWDAAYRFLQDALTHAVSDGTVTEIRVAQGTYVPDQDEANPGGTADRGATFRLINSVAVMGGFAGSGTVNPDDRDITLYETTLSGQGLSFDHVVTVLDTDDSAVLDGFTIAEGGIHHTSGSPGGVASGEIHGGGIYIANGSPTVSNCRFYGNVVSYSCIGDCPGIPPAGSGGAMYNEASSPAVIDCEFVENGAGGRGAAVLNVDSNPTMINCTFRGNAQVAIANSGDSTLTVINCLFEDNSESSGAGAGAIQDSSWGEGGSTVLRSVFRRNASHPYMSGGAGAIMSNRATVIDCVFVGNFGEGAGGVKGTSEVINCTFAGNQHAAIKAASVTNCIIWRNSPHQITGNATVHYSAVQGGWSGAGFHNIDANPMFLRNADPGPDGEWGTNDDDFGDLRLQPGSPCIDAGNNWAIADLADTDLDGNPRFADDPATADTGCGMPVVVDMGAYEYQGEPTAVVYADLTGDGVVGLDDFETLAGCWSSSGEPCCLADLDLDGNVGVVDFLILLANWEP